MTKKDCEEKKIFISFRHAYQDKAEAVRDELERNGLKCWMSSRDVPPSGNFAEEVIKALKASIMVVFVYGVEANDSVHIKKEIKRSFKMQKPIIPYKIDESFPDDELQFYLNNKQWIDASSKPDYRDSFGELVKHAKRIRGEEVKKCKGGIDYKIPVLVAVALIVIIAAGFMVLNGGNETSVVNTTDSSNVSLDFIEQVSDGGNGKVYSAIGSVPEGLSNSSDDVVHVDFYNDSGKVVESEDTKIAEFDGHNLGSAQIDDDNIVKASVELQDSKGNVISSAESSDVEKYE